MSDTYPANAYPITIFQGRRFRIYVDLVDPTGAYRDFSTDEVRGQIRTAPNASAITAEFACSVVSHWETEESGEAVEITIGGTDTADLAAGSYVYDIEVVPSSGEDDTFLLIGGTCQVLPEVTR